MNFFACLAVAISIALANIVVDGGKVCKKPYCGTAQDREAVLIATQKKFQQLVQSCDYAALLGMSLPEASFSTIDYDCPFGCCVTEGSMEKWWTYYTCNDKVYYPVEPVSISCPRNGTTIYSATEIVAAGDGTLYAYALDFHWDLQEDCTLKLSFIGGHSYNCPAYLDDPIPCEVCNP